MERQKKREFQAKIRSKYPKDENLRRIIDALPKRYRDMILERVIQKTDWNKMQEKYYYSERQMRNILDEALEELHRRLKNGKKSV